MFSKPIFKQSLKSNIKLWLIFTGVVCLLSGVIIAVFDPRMMANMVDALKDSSMANMVPKEQLDSMTSLLGMLSGSFYDMQGILMPMIFIIITANSLVAAQVDRGSMAYLLSTPIKRVKVVVTQASYLITTVFAMFLVLTLSGLIAVQVFQGGIISTAHTADVKAIAKVLNVEKNEVAENLSLIMSDPALIKEGAIARELDEEVYIIYLTMKISGVSSVEGEESQETKNPEAEQQEKEFKEKLNKGFAAAAEVLNIKDIEDYPYLVKKIKSNEAALNAAVEASQMPKEVIMQSINMWLASDEVKLDEGINFSVPSFIKLNVGAFLLMFAISGISFMFSCIFNLSKHSFALGAGIPIASFVFNIMSQASKSLEFFKYISLNTLFDTGAITSGGSFIIEFVALAVIGIVFYTIGIKWFKEKDLPL